MCTNRGSLEGIENAGNGEYLARGNDLDGVLRAVIGAGGVGLDLLDEIHALEDLAEHDVLAVEPGGVDGGQEELSAVSCNRTSNAFSRAYLRAVGVLTSVGHRESTREVLIA